MQYTGVESIFFSATGTTKTVVEGICKELAGPCTAHDLLQRPLAQPLRLPASTLALVAMPVFSGRIPPYAMQSLAKVTGNQTPVIAVVVYGNRDYDDALLELKITLEGNGFIVVGAAAFIARHSIFSKVASDRPDAADMHIITDFARQCAQKLEKYSDIEQVQRVQVPGNTPYKEAKAPALKPCNDDSCILCGACADICPAQAITVGATYRKDDAQCFSCAACITVCPVSSQAFRGPEYDAFSTMFFEKFNPRKEPELFL